MINKENIKKDIIEEFRKYKQMKPTAQYDLNSKDKMIIIKGAAKALLDRDINKISERLITKYKEEGINVVKVGFGMTRLPVNSETGVHIIFFYKDFKEIVIEVTYNIKISHTLSANIYITENDLFNLEIVDTKNKKKYTVEYITDTRKFYKNTLKINEICRNYIEYPVIKEIVKQLNIEPELEKISGSNKARLYNAKLDLLLYTLENQYVNGMNTVKTHKEKIDIKSLIYNIDKELNKIKNEEEKKYMLFKYSMFLKDVSVIINNK